jgi:hypothetical protein
MAWINSPACEALCLFLEIDPAAIREKAAALYREFLAKDRPRPRLGRPRKAPETSGGVVTFKGKTS